MASLLDEFNILLQCWKQSEDNSFDPNASE